MSKVKFIIIAVLVPALAALYSVTDQCLAQLQDSVQLPQSHDISAVAQRRNSRVTHADRQAAAERAAVKGMLPASSGVATTGAATIKATMKTPTKASMLGAATIGAAPAAAPMAAQMAMPGTAPHYFGPYPNYANSPLPIVDPAGGAIAGGIRKFIDGLPGLTEAGANNLGQYIPVAVADINTYQASDYYEIAVVQYREKMHTDLPATLLRGYVQLETPDNAAISKHVPLTNANMDGTTSPVLLNGQQVYAVDNPHYLGPLISATKNRPVRILFRNLLPAGVAGNLFIPVDTTVMGSGMGPDMGGMHEHDPQSPMCGMMPKPAGCFAENRATLHLHGGISPWISDGTPHQWVTPADENTPYPEGVSVHNVPDMPDPGPGALTFFYTNQQSARLMFYHDHAWGITRLNVYAGEAAAYLITDTMEKNLINQGIIPADQIPLVIQDKTFVPDMEQLAMQDPTWDMDQWGGFGQLWVPHVYVPAQNPGDSSGVNQFGRWAYGPWFWPPTLNIDYPPVANPYYDPNCDPDDMWCEPLKIPGTPYVSMGMEAFNDTPVVNGTVYPTVTVEPKSYRFRILSAANDRFFNLQFYVADSTGTEVALNAAEVQAALDDPAGVFPTPDLALSPAGPDWIQIGTEGGFLPSPVVIPPQPITWVTDPTVFNAGNVDQHSLLLGPAERADVVVDFSAYAGKTLILYNDAPAAFPARDPRYDYYTGNADLTDTGGAPSTLPGYGPNTRTIMQIKVAAAPAAPAFNLAALQTAFKSAGQGGLGVFENSQNPIIVGQGAYNPAYGSSFMTNGPRAGLVQIFDTQFTFNTLLNQGTTNLLTIPLLRKAIQDEMGEAFDKEYGRMSGNLGLEAPQAQGGLQQNLVLYPYVNPASEILDGLELPMGTIDLAPISRADDGTQIWKITHNGVDTHPIHFHMYDVQLINRVGWDGIIRRPDPNELGWKDTVRISPLEDTIVAFRPVVPKIPFGVLDSIRPLNPMMPLGSTAMFVNTDANAAPINPPIINELTNFGWEYVWHCHILSHEEMDMMRPVSVSVSRTLPAVSRLITAVQSRYQVNLSWTDGTPVNYVDPASWGNPANEVGFVIERATVANGSAGAYEEIGYPIANATAYTDTTAVMNTTYSYRVIAYNAAGDAPASNAIQVSMRGSSVSLLPAALTFGQQLMGTSSAAQAVTLRNTGNTTLRINSITINGADAASFTRTTTCGTTLGAGRTCTISVRLRPAKTGPLSAVLTVTDVDPWSPQTVDLSGIGTGPVASVSPAALTFSSSLNVTSAAQVITVSNTGTGPMRISSISRSGTNAGQFANTTTCGPFPRTLAAGGSCTVSVTFRPASFGTKSALLNVNVAAPGTSKSATLTGTIIAPTFTLSPAALTFSSSLNVTSAAQDITVSNTGPVPMTISGISRSGANAAQFANTTTCGPLPRTLAAGGSCSVSVTFRSTSNGTKSALLNVSVTGSATQSVSLTGTVLAPAITLSPASLAFGSQAVNVTSVAQTVTVTNTGVVPLQISSIARSGMNAGQFANTTTCGPFPRTLAAGGSCTASVTFRPTSTGAKIALLNVSITGSATQSVSLTGTGSVPTFTLLPTSLPFGNQTAGTISVPRTLTVTNTGSIALTINSIVLGGTNPGDFAQTNNCGLFPAALAPGLSCTIDVTFKPVTKGLKSASVQVRVAVPATNRSTSLSGTGQ